MPRPARSQLEIALDSAIRDVFPHVVCRHEMPIKVRGTTLYVDRVIPSLDIAIEVDGRQHDEFSEFHHGDAAGFKASKARDLIKEQWLLANGYILIRFKSADKISAVTLREKLLKAYKHGSSRLDVRL